MLRETTIWTPPLAARLSRFILGIVLASAVFPPFASGGEPEAKDILEKTLRAIGGSQAWQKVTAITRNATLRVGDREATAITIWKAPYFFHHTVRLGATSLRVASNGQQGWMNDHSANNIAIENWNTYSCLFGNRYLLNRSQVTAKYMGVEKVGDREADVVDLRFPFGTTLIAYYDHQTSLLVKDVSRHSAPGIDNVLIESFYEDYRDVDGVKLPYRFREVVPGPSPLNVQFQVTSYEINSPVDDQQFKASVGLAPGIAVDKAPTEKFLLDTDIGTDVDDALAIVFAAHSPEVQLLSVTTVSGKPWVRARLARKLLDLTGHPEVPVAAGRATPLPSKRFGIFLPNGIWMGHEGKGVLTDAEIAAPNAETGPDAASQMISTLMASSEKVTVITIGATTNFAEALRREPRIAGKVKQYIAMGGNVMRPPSLGGHEMSALVEFNFNCDREAAATVLSGGFPITLAPVELTLRTYLRREDIEVLRQGGPDAKALANLLEVWDPIFHNLNHAAGVPDSAIRDWACHLHDVLAIMALVNPKMIKFETVRLSVAEDPDAPALPGMKGILYTRQDPKGLIEVRVATDVDPEQLRSFVLKRLMQP